MQEFLQQVVEGCELAVPGNFRKGIRDRAPARRYKVSLFLSDMGFLPIPGVGRAVHSSVVVDRTEYEFCGGGIIEANGPKSHDRFRGKPEVVDLGYTTKSGDSMVEMLSTDFPPGTYDLLRKNCNTFSDCALFYLVGQRMDDQHRALEKIGATLNQYTSIISMLFRGYSPNPRADQFKTLGVIDSIQKKGRPAKHAKGGA